MAPVDKSSLERWRELDCRTVVQAIATYAKQDASYVPQKSPNSTRWHLLVEQHEFELLLTGSKFWDVRARCGGGGGIDLVMHLTGENFQAAAKRLRKTGI